MENKASKTRPLNIAFVVDADLLQRLAVILGEVADSLDYTVKFSDGSTVQYRDIRDIITLPNSTMRSITSLIAGAARKEQSAYVTLKMSSEPYVEYTVSGSLRNVTYFADQLDDWTAAIKQWYSLLLDGPGSALLLLGAFAFPVWITNRLPIFFPALRPWTLGILIVAAIGEFWFFKLFPKGIFAIGHGAKRYQFLRYLRNLLLGILVTLCVGVSRDWMRDWIKWHT